MSARRIVGMTAALFAVAWAVGCAESGESNDADARADVADDAAGEADVPEDIVEETVEAVSEMAMETAAEDGAADEPEEEAAPADRDGDTVPDSEDAFPDDVNEWADNDSDTIGDNADTDDDNDTIVDGEELVPGEDCRVSNPLRADTDGDTISDPDDPYPTDPWPEFVINQNDVGTYYFFLSNRDGTFEPRIEGGDDIGDNYMGFTIADFDNDGKMDFIGHGATPDGGGLYDLYFFYRTTRRDEFVQRLVGPTDDPLGGTVADVNNDTLIDIVDFKMIRPPGEYITQVYADTYLNNGTIGTATCVYDEIVSPECAFTHVEAYDLTSMMAGEWVYMQSYQAVDITGDGIKDIVFGYYSSGGNDPVPVYVLEGVGDGTFVNPTLLFTHNASGTQSPANSIVFADFTNDTVGDVIAGLDDDGDPGQAWIYTGIEGGTFATMGIPTFDVNLLSESGSDEPGATGSARCFDFDFDGNMDILVGH